MSNQVLNWPRKLLTDEEKTIRATLARINAASPTSDAVIATPYRYVPVEEADSLQFIITSMATGGIIWLGIGTFPGDLTIPATGYVLTFIGSGIDLTVLTGSVLVESASIHFQDLTIRATGKAYGMKLFKSGAGIARCGLTRVIIGATSSVSGDGPVDGLYLDGAILTKCVQCSFQFCTGKGLHVDSSSGVYSTNANTFEDCTFSGNAYGVYLTEGGDGVAAMMLHRFFGGNIESNTTTDFYADECSHIIISGVDFESAQATGQYIDIRNSNPVIVEYCNFTGGGPTLAFIMSGVECGVFRYNRTSGFNTARAIGIFTESCVQCEAYGNVLNADGFGRVINNRGSMWGVT